MKCVVGGDERCGFVDLWKMEPHDCLCPDRELQRAVLFSIRVQPHDGTGVDLDVLGFR